MQSVRRECGECGGGGARSGLTWKVIKHSSRPCATRATACTAYQPGFSSTLRRITRGFRVVVAHADERARDLVLVGDARQLGERVRLGEARRVLAEVEALLEEDLRWHRLLDELGHRVDADRRQHLRQVGLARAEVPRLEAVERRERSRRGERAAAAVASGGGGGEPAGRAAEQRAGRGRAAIRCAAPGIQSATFEAGGPRRGDLASPPHCRMVLRAARGDGAGSGSRPASS